MINNITFQVANDLSLLRPLLNKKLIRSYNKIQPEYLVNKTSWMEFLVMRIIYENNIGTMLELAGHLNISKQRLNPIINKLEEMEYVIRVRDKANRRQVKVNILPKGSEYIKRRIEEYVGFIESRLNNLNEDELHTLKQSLNYIFQVVSRFPDE